MAKYLLLKHYRGAPDAVNNVPMDRWTPEEVSEHIQYMADFAARLPRGRMLETEHLVGTLLYLVGPASEGVTGTVITVDDGQTPRSSSVRYTCARRRGSMPSPRSRCFIRPVTAASS